MKPFRWWGNQERRIKRKLGYYSTAGKLIRLGFPTLLGMSRSAAPEPKPRRSRSSSGLQAVLVLLLLAVIASPSVTGCGDGRLKQHEQQNKAQAPVATAQSSANTLIDAGATQAPGKRPTDGPTATVALRPTPLPQVPKEDHDYVPDEPKPRAERDWTDRTGNFHVKATLLDIADGIARLQRSNKIVRVSVDKLSDDDFAYVSATGAKSEPRTLTGKIIGVHDGDTIILLDEHDQQHKIRLASIDAPERNQAFGQRAREALSKKVFQKTVQIKWREHDKYGRTIGDLFLDDRWINKEMVQEGWAWHYTKYSDSEELARAEAAARKAGHGLWSKPDAEPPWEFRHNEKTRPAKPVVRAERSNPTPLFSSTPAHSSSSSSSSSNDGDVQVHGYTRKDGTYVKPHTRRRPSR